MVEILGCVNRAERCIQNPRIRQNLGGQSVWSANAMRMPFNVQHQPVLYLFSIQKAGCQRRGCSIPSVVVFTVQKVKQQTEAPLSLLWDVPTPRLYPLGSRGSLLSSSSSKVAMPLGCSSVPNSDTAA